MASQGSFSNTMTFPMVNNIHRELSEILDPSWKLTFLQDGEPANMESRVGHDPTEKFAVNHNDHVASNWQLLLSPANGSNNDEILVTSRDNVLRVIMGKTTWKKYCSKEVVRRVIELVNTPTATSVS